MKKYLAFIEPLEDITGRESVNCNVKFVTGDLAHRTRQYQLTTSIFSYYFWGFAFEVIILDDRGMVNSIRDITGEDKIEFSVELVSTVTFNNVTHEVLASNGYVYNLDESLFARYCRPMLNRICYEIATSQNFFMALYTLNGAAASILFDKNIPSSDKAYKYALIPGYITANKNTLKYLVPKTQEEFDRNDKLSQEDIDKLIADMRR